MKILFCAAEQEELNCAIQALRQYESKIAGKIQVEFLLTGIGTTSTCYKLTKKLVEAEAQGEKFYLVINIGLGGSYNMEKFPIGTTALVDKEFFGDLGFMTVSGFQTLFDTNTLDANLFPFVDGALKMEPLPETFNNITDKYKRAVGVTVQTVTGAVPDSAHANTKEELIAKYSPDIESMEGAGFFYVCLNERVKFMELRSVSNEVGQADASKWDTPAALDSLTETCKIFFKRLAETLTHEEEE